MSTSTSSFELILEEVIKQKHVLEKLLEENEALRQQLADLRAGKGIAVDILGQRYLLSYEEPAAEPEAVSASTPDEITEVLIPVPEASPSQAPEPVAVEPTAPVAEESPAIFNEEQAVGPQALRDTSDDFLLEEVSGDGTPFPATSSSFLEEAMLEEFANATTRQMHVWSGPITNHPTLDEKEKATLRKELMGSFLLE
jgi:hypothetical protein